MASPVVEAELGFGPYVTTTPALGGRLKARIEDFRVDEVGDEPAPDPRGTYTAARIRLTNWETNAFLRAASDRLGISRKKIHFSGTKDKRGVTERWFTFDAPVGSVETLAQLPGVALVAQHPTRRELELGQHRANRFHIVLRDVAHAPPEAQALAEATWQGLVDAGGVPNYFGPQRFGARRATTHRVGERMVRGDFWGAVLTYLEEPLSLSAGTHEAWKEALARRDWRSALALLGEGAEPERALLHRLQETEDPIRALQVFPATLQRLFVHALQSWLFNRALARRIESALGHSTPLVGDLAAPIEDGECLETWVPVRPTNLAKVQEEVARGRAAVTGLLPGTEAPFAEGETGRIERSVLEEHDLRPRDFLIPEQLDWSSKGTRRPLHVTPSSFEVEAAADEVFPGRTKLSFSFLLPAGAYATTVLREFIKSPNVADYA